MNDHHIHDVFQILTERVKSWNVPVVTLMGIQKKDPFKILITTVLSLRTKDETTANAASRLFKSATTPEQMIALGNEKIEPLIYPVGFYKTKAKNIIAICQILLEKYAGLVPDDIDVLLTLPGVGRKTANLVVTQGYRKPGICVDTHVHRISNRLGYVVTQTPEATEFALREKLPHAYWMQWNDLLVSFGQNLCKPISPFCSKCPILSYCDRIGVLTSR